MKFRLTTLFWFFALSASAMATFGAPLGLLLASAVLWVRSGLPVLPKPLEVVVALLVIGLLIALLLPVIQVARVNQRSVSSSGNLRLLSIAIQIYEQEHGHLPPPYTFDDTGKVLHSWRTLLLPFVEYGSLHAKLDFEASWNSPGNLAAFGSGRPYLYESPRFNPSGDCLSETHYFAVVDPRTVWSPVESMTREHVADDPSQTILLIEAYGLGVDWYEPRDLTLDEALELLVDKREQAPERIDPGFFVSSRYVDDRVFGLKVLFADGHVASIYPAPTRELALALLTRSGGEDLDEWEKLHGWRGHSSEYLGYVIHWGRIWGLTLFVLLTCWPRVLNTTQGGASA